MSKLKWTKEKVIAEILDRHKDKKPLNFAHINKSLYSAGIRKFGSWKKAVEFSGISYSEIKVDIDIVGKRFVKLIVTSDTKRKDNKLLRKCLCDCGNTEWIMNYNLLSGRRKSCGCLRKLPPGKAARNSLLLGYKRDAKKRNLVWKLTEEKFDVLTRENCKYCDSKPETVKKHIGMNGHYIYNGIDRIDSKIGYTSKNVVTCCKICNVAKRNMELSDFLSWIQRLCNRFQKIKNQH